MGIEVVVANHLSKPRLEPYIQAAGSTSGAMQLYRWNLELSGAIHEALGVVEVAVRNSIDQQLQIWNPTRPARSGERSYGTDWVEQPAAPLYGILNPRGRNNRPRKSTFESAKKRARYDSNDRDPSHPRHGAAPNHDDIVAHITFGAWVKLLPSKRMELGLIGPDQQRALWENALRHSFPHHTDPLVVHYWVNRMYRLRNRVAHVEPLISTDVMSYHRTAARLLRAIEPRLGDWYAGISRIPEVFSSRPGS